MLFAFPQPNLPRSLFAERFPSLERNLQGFVRQYEKSAPNSLTLSFRGPPELIGRLRCQSQLRSSHFRRVAGLVAIS